MLLRERHDRILDSLRGGGATVRHLASSLQVSESTIRRDLDELDRTGAVTRTYGGAVLAAKANGHADITDDGRFEGVFDTERDLDLKTRVARAAAELVEDGAVIILDIGTTTPLMARALRDRPITVITSNLAVVDELRGDSQVDLVILGGVLRRNYRSLVGSLTESALQQLNADMLFLSCTGVRPSGHVVDNMAVEAPIKHSMISAADQVVLLATRSKFPGTGALRLCSLADVDVVVSSPGDHEPQLDVCRAAGGKVIIA